MSLCGLLVTLLIASRLNIYLSTTDIEGENSFLKRNNKRESQPLLIPILILHGKWYQLENEEKKYGNGDSFSMTCKITTYRNVTAFEFYFDNQFRRSCLTKDYTDNLNYIKIGRHRASCKYRIGHVWSGKSEEVYFKVLPKTPKITWIRPNGFNQNVPPPLVLGCESDDAVVDSYYQFYRILKGWNKLGGTLKPELPTRSVSYELPSLDETDTLVGSVVPFTCTVTVPEGENSIRSLYSKELVIGRPLEPILTTSLHSLSAPYGKRIAVELNADLTLTCKSKPIYVKNGKPYWTFYTFYKNRKRLTDIPSRVNTYKVPTTLPVSHDTYTCTAFIFVESLHSSICNVTVLQEICPIGQSKLELEASLSGVESGPEFWFKCTVSNPCPIRFKKLILSIYISNKNGARIRIWQGNSSDELPKPKKTTIDTSSLDRWKETRSNTVINNNAAKCIEDYNKYICGLKYQYISGSSPPQKVEKSIEDFKLARLNGKPKMSSHPESVCEGDSAVFTCTGDISQPKVGTIIWQVFVAGRRSSKVFDKHDDQVSETESPGDCEKSLVSSTITLSDIRQNWDDFQVQCQVTNPDEGPHFMTDCSHPSQQFCDRSSPIQVKYRPPDFDIGVIKMTNGNSISPKGMKTGEFWTLTASVTMTKSARKNYKNNLNVYFESPIITICQMDLNNFTPEKFHTTGDTICKVDKTVMREHVFYGLNITAKAKHQHSQKVVKFKLTGAFPYIKTLTCCSESPILPVINDVATGDTSNEDTSNEDTSNEDTSNGDTSNGDTSNGDTSNGDTSNGDTSNGDTSNEDMSNGDTSKGDKTLDLTSTDSTEQEGETGNKQKKKMDKPYSLILLASIGPPLGFLLLCGLPWCFWCLWKTRKAQAKNEEGTELKKQSKDNLADGSSVEESSTTETSATESPASEPAETSSTVLEISSSKQKAVIYKTK